MQTFLHAKASFTLRDGEHRYRRLEKEFHHRYPRMIQHMYRSGFNQKRETLVAVLEHESMPQRWNLVSEELDRFSSELSQHEFFIDRIKIQVPLLELGLFRQSEIGEFKYVLVSEVVLCLKEKSPDLLKICAENGLMPMLDTIPTARPIWGHDSWNIAGRYDTVVNGAIQAEAAFEYAKEEFRKLGLNLVSRPEVSAVISDDNDEEDLSWVAPPRPEGELDTPF